MSAVKILIAEDDRTLQEMYKFKFDGAGFSTQTANDGRDALEKAHEFDPDLILLDLKMPHMTGEQMLERLRSKDWGKNMRVIVLTNISRDEAPQVLRFLNVDRYVVKAHHTPSQVVDIVREVLK